MKNLQVLAVGMAMWVCAGAAMAEKPSPLAGTWVLVAADTLQPDGRRVHGYGEHPQGRLLIDRQGRYSLQIYRSETQPFVSGDKGRGTEAEYRDAVMRLSAHMGTVRLEPGSKTIVFEITRSLFPNWEGAKQMRQYELRDGVLSYQVPASATGNGTVAVSEWRKE
ncbi:MAG: lipocalin-like domain-containing protein [Lysobacter sp.]